MTLAIHANRLGAKSLLIGLGLLWSVDSTSVVAQESQSLHTGKELFQRQWVHVPPEIPDQGDLDRGDYAAKLKTLPGDGLGPMFNATSCESCHVAGGGADVIGT